MTFTSLDINNAVGTLQQAIVVAQAKRDAAQVAFDVANSELRVLVNRLAALQAYQAAA